MNCMERFYIKDNVVIITGAAGLLGEMHARAVIEAGGIPVLIDINDEKLEEKKKVLMESYGEKTKLETYVADITKKEELKNILNDLIKKYNRVDSLINNACNNPKMKNSKLGAGRLEDFSTEEWDADLSVGLYGAMCCSQVFGEYMSKNGGGVILNISSDLGVIAPNQNLYKIDGEKEENQPKKPVTYSVIKWGLIGLTKYLSTYWADKNVRSNAVAFGGVFNNQSKEFLDRVTQLIPMGRMASKDEYMSSIIYLISDASSYMTGALVSIDGGRTAW